MSKAALALALEDQLDLWFQEDIHSGAEPVKLSRPIDLRGERDFGKVAEALRELFTELADRLADHLTLDKLFESIASTVVSVPGVVSTDGKTLLQLPRWESPAYDAAIEEQLNFSELLCGIAAAIIKDRTRQDWPENRRKRFADWVSVVNDSAACAILVWSRRVQSRTHEQLNPELADFAYIKLHWGVNVSAVEYRQEHHTYPKARHGEAGHGYPVPHEIDWELGFRGVCPFHSNGCFEGLMAAPAFRKRAETYKAAQMRLQTVARKRPKDAKRLSQILEIVKAWNKELRRLKAEKLQGGELNSTLLSNILAEGVEDKPIWSKAGIDLLGHYAAQLVYQVIISPRAPGDVILGGRMVTSELVADINDKVTKLASGYPSREALRFETINQHVVRIDVTADEVRTMEVAGALELARSKADANLRGRV